ncbi:MAG: hypothetical protein KAW01_00610, partial [Deltaproteobacteria bacterium]|nr:hypothetical protein [Deltaproteobacteria bacterium]
MNKKELLQFEKKADEIAKNLSIFSLPLRSVLMAFYGIIDNLIHGDRLSENPQPRKLAGFNTAYRLSYIISLLIKCPQTPLGVDATDAISPVTEDIFEEVNYLISYAHLFEILPATRNDYYEVKLNGNEFILSNKDEEFEKYEAKDIILNELSLPFIINPPNKDFAYFQAQAESVPTIDPIGCLLIINKYFNWYMKYSFESFIFTNEGLYKSIGVTINQFTKFRAAWLSIAQFHLKMLSAIAEKLRIDINNKVIQNELLEWQVPLWKESFVKESVLKISGLTDSQYENLMNLYCISPDNLNTVGDGFFPPILKFENSLLFQPSILQIMLSARNIPYALNQSTKEVFDNVFSETMEPKLIFIAKQIFESLEDVQIFENIQWENGEIDMLIYRKSENAAVQIQAKGAIPPQGARMVKGVGNRITEGIEQLNTFSQLKQAEKDDILSKVLGEKSENVTI